MKILLAPPKAAVELKIAELPPRGKINKTPL